MIAGIGALKQFRRPLKGRSVGPETTGLVLSRREHNHAPLAGRVLVERRARGVDSIRSSVLPGVESSAIGVFS
jgi:hypothetical protein